MIEVADTLTVILPVAVVANGLLAGVFFVFSIAICPGLRGVDDGTYIRSFRAINKAILNGTFLSVFFIAPGAAAVCVVLYLGWGGSASLLLLLAGAVCAALTFSITAAGNVPLNRELEQAPVATEQERRAARQRFENPWNRRNLARTLTSVAAFTMLTLASLE